MRCVGGCDIPAPLHTSASLHLDDYSINETLACLTQTVPIVPDRLNDLLRHAGMGTISKRNVASAKSELEPVLAHEAQASMALALERDLLLNSSEPKPCLTTDTGWDHGRNGSHATTAFLSATTGKVVHEETTRRSDHEIKSSQSMEKAGFTRGVVHSPTLRAAGYSRMGMDGCCAIMKVAEGAGYDCQGDGWHCTKCKAKHFGNHCDAYAPRSQPCDAEKAAKAMLKPARPSGPSETPPKLGNLSTSQPPPEAAMRAELAAAGEAVAAEANVSKQFTLLRRCQHATRRFTELGFELPARGASSLTAHVDRLGSFFAIRARQSVYVGREAGEWAAFDNYCLAQLNAEALRSARTARNATLKRERAAARGWEGYFRTVYCSVFHYTASLRNTTNPQTKADWTDAERTAEAQRLYPRASLALCGEFLDDESLDTISHPASKKSETDFRWQPPDVGFIEVGSLAWEILEGWVRDPQCLSKFRYYIDNISTAMNVHPLHS